MILHVSARLLQTMIATNCCRLLFLIMWKWLESNGCLESKKISSLLCSMWTKSHSKVHLVADLKLSLIFLSRYRLPCLDCGCSDFHFLEALVRVCLRLKVYSRPRKSNILLKDSKTATKWTLSKSVSKVRIDPEEYSMFWKMFSNTMKKNTVCEKS